MKILLANKFYYRRGGDCIYTMNLEKMLKEKGHEVAVYAMQYPENEKSEWSGYWPSAMTKLDAFTRPFGARQVMKGFSRLMDDFKPEVVHLNNIHTQLSPVIAKIAHEKGARVVWTLHDTKLVCPCYTCTRAGKWCTECFTDKKAVIRHRCMPGGLPGAVIGYLEAQKWNREVLQECVDLFLPPSKFMMDTCVEGGYKPEKFRVLCNFIDVTKVKGLKSEEVKGLKGDYYVYLGRVNEVKGVRTLCKAASQLDKRLVVIGGGELLPELQKTYVDCKQIEFKGQMQWEEFMPILRGARFMVLPAEWSENNPLTVIESQSLGTPVLGARIGGIPELIESLSPALPQREGVVPNGMTFTSGDVEDLKDKINKMFNHEFDYDAIAKNAIERYSSEAYYEKLMASYKDEE
ncbi:glycosyl transferase family 1 [Prevotella sp. P5-92]|uniref:glycosyltransferase n=1 Tax=Prevotella sp. P5-92 TaxID=2024222 RepID=UPI000B97A506|nr:glycosyltransferase [Prevotella sp. P5-92]OYP56261.1 glycosyl transferase family 1 [Prevotella sp. P5-92]